MTSTAALPPPVVASSDRKREGASACSCSRAAAAAAAGADGAAAVGAWLTDTAGREAKKRQGVHMVVIPAVIMVQPSHLLDFPTWLTRTYGRACALEVGRLLRQQRTAAAELYALMLSHFDCQVSCCLSEVHPQDAARSHLEMLLPGCARSSGGTGGRRGAPRRNRCQRPAAVPWSGQPLQQGPNSGCRSGSSLLDWLGAANQRGQHPNRAGCHARWSGTIRMDSEGMIRCVEIGRWLSASRNWTPCGTMSCLL